MNDGGEQFLFVVLGIFLGIMICVVGYVILAPASSSYDQGACEVRGGTYTVIDNEYTCITYKEIK